MVAYSVPNIFISDMESAVTFYRDQLGFAEVRRTPPEGAAVHVVLQSGASQLALSTDGTIKRVGLSPTRGNSSELLVWCEDVDAETERLRQHGVEVLVEPYDHVARHRRAYVSDPDGNWIALIDA